MGEFHLQLQRELARFTLANSSNSAVAVCFVDLVRNCGAFSPEEAEDYLKMGVLNGLFVLGRSIGLIAHFLDQKRLRTGLYRHPWDGKLIHLFFIQQANRFFRYHISAAFFGKRRARKRGQSRSCRLLNRSPRFCGASGKDGVVVYKGSIVSDLAFYVKSWST